MNKIMHDPFTYYFPRIDIHGETTLTCVAIIEGFINDNLKLKNKNIVIIHGKGTGALKKATQELLKKNKMVMKYYMNPLNEGETIVELKLH